MNAAFYRAYGEPGAVVHGEWFVRAEGRDFASGSYTYATPIPFCLTVSDRDDSDCVVVAESSEPNRRSICRCVFTRRLSQRYVDAGFDIDGSTPHEIQVELILRTGADFLLEPDPESR